MEKDYDEELNYKIIDENSISIIIDDNLKSLVPLHLITDSEEEIKYEYDVLMNNVSEGQGILIGEYPNLKRGKRYLSGSVGYAWRSLLPWRWLCGICEDS